MRRQYQGGEGGTRGGVAAQTCRLAAAITNSGTNKQAKVAAAVASIRSASRLPLRHDTSSSSCPYSLLLPPLLLLLLQQSHRLSAFQFTRNANRLSFSVCLNIWHVRVSCLLPPAHSQPQSPSLPTPQKTHTSQPATVTNPPRPNDDILCGRERQTQLMSCSCQKFCCCLRLRLRLRHVIYTSLFSTNAAH